MNPATILIVDDDPNHIKILSSWLRTAGYNTLVATDGLLAVSIARRQRPDLILLDLGLPGGGGYSVLRRLKGMNTASDIPVVVLSAQDADENQGQAVGAGAEAYIQKPADLDALLATIRRLLGDREPKPAG